MESGAAMNALKSPPGIRPFGPVTRALIFFGSAKVAASIASQFCRLSQPALCSAAGHFFDVSFGPSWSQHFVSKFLTKIGSGTQPPGIGFGPGGAGSGTRDPRHLQV